MSEQNFRMIDVGEKMPTARRALAEGRIRLAPAAFAAVRDRTNPKGDVLAMAEVAGIMAAKRTADLLPLCHPLPLESVRVSCRLEAAANSISVTCEAATTSKTGVEMEALCGVNGALLAIYDLSKAVDPVLTISEIRLLIKEGGKSGRWVHPDARASSVGSGNLRETPKADAVEETLRGVRAVVVTVSDRATRSADYDTSGPTLAEHLTDRGADVARRIVPDVRSEIAAAIRQAASEAQLVVLTGGTGLSPRDVTPEAVADVCDRLIPGIGELLRLDGSRHTPMAWLSRSAAGLIGGSLVIALPGSRKAVMEGAAVLVDLLPHALHTARGGDHAARL